MVRYLRLQLKPELNSLQGRTCVFTCVVVACCIVVLIHCYVVGCTGSWAHLVKMKGMRCPMCKASEEGPLPVYR